ncbi:oxygen-independent coproporphyrinogen III oxidase [Oleiagrimonas sp. C23AA]|nr:oxygen-independent coproporphyrinogen III oxidase [Oleiagrimonas sp. C23AA]NII11853.1 oxygen-independent coproporphyrinogen III oxidase [Oleiagrimonas sp. C23AA]
MTSVLFDSALMARYGTSGPRYISYPTTLHFHAGFSEVDLRTAVSASNEELIPRDLSLYVHVPYCFNRWFQCRCRQAVGTKGGHEADRYLAYLAREVALTASLFDRDRKVVQLRFGGGTPNFLDTERMRALMRTLDDGFSLSRGPEREFAVEIDPEFASVEQVAALAELGLNRMSLGIQDFDPRMREAVNRVHSVERVRELMQTGRSHGVDSISVDVIYGLPHQSVDGFSRTLEQVVELAPDRIAAYSHTHSPQSLQARWHVPTAKLPDAPIKSAMFGRMLEMFTAAGYVYLGMEQFVRAEDELARAQRAGTLQRNVQGYSTHGDGDIVGLGVSAIGRIGDSYSQNLGDLPGYYAALDAGHLPVARGFQLSDDDLIRRELIGQLVCHGRVNKSEFSDRHRLLFDVYFAADLRRLAPLVEDDLVRMDGQVLEVTPRGRLLVRHVAMCFDAYLHDGPSRTGSSRAS